MSAARLLRLSRPLCLLYLLPFVYCNYFNVLTSFPKASAKLRGFLIPTKYFHNNFHKKKFTKYIFH